MSKEEIFIKWLDDNTQMCELDFSSLMETIRNKFIEIFLNKGGNCDNNKKNP